MKKIEVKKCGKWWYVIVKDEQGDNMTMASFTTKRSAEKVRDHWINEKFFGEAEAI